MKRDMTPAEGYRGEFGQGRGSPKGLRVARLRPKVNRMLLTAKRSAWQRTTNKYN